ncbi:hypothetical protein [Spirosoma areae]
MKTIFHTLVLMSVLANISYAQSNTDEMLSAPNARSFIQLWPDLNEHKFFYILDKDLSRKHYKSLTPNSVIGVPKRDGEVTLTVRFFNPLQYNVVTTDTLLEDPSYQNIGKFATALTELIKELPVINAPAASGKENAGTSSGNTGSGLPSSITAPFSLTRAGDFTKQQVAASLAVSSRPIASPATESELQSVVQFINNIGFDDLAEWKYLFIQGRVTCVDTNTTTIKRLKILDSHYYNGNFRVMIRKALNFLSKPDNIKDLMVANNHFLTIIDSLKKVNSANKETLKSFDDDISGDIQKNLIGQASQNDNVCSTFLTYSQIVFKRFVRACLDGQRKRDEMLQIAEKLHNEIATVIKITDETFGDNDGGTHLQNAIIIGRYNIDETQMHDVNIIFRKRLLNLDADPPILTDTNEKIIGRLRIRSSQTLIPEFSMGGVYTDLTYPTYGVKVLTESEAKSYNDASGTTSYSAAQSVVDEVSSQRLPIVLVGMLNLTLNAFNGLAHPLVQVGVGTGRNLPTFLFGGGLRLKWQKPIVISGGAIWSWKKQFTNLAPRRPLSGPAQLEKDLRIEFDTRPNFYLGLQIGL